MFNGEKREFEANLSIKWKKKNDTQTYGLVVGLGLDEHMDLGFIMIEERLGLSLDRLWSSLKLFQ